MAKNPNVPQRSVDTVPAATDLATTATPRMVQNAPVAEPTLAALNAVATAMAEKQQAERLALDENVRRAMIAAATGLSQP